MSRGLIAYRIRIGRQFCRPSHFRTSKELCTSGTDHFMMSSRCLVRMMEEEKEARREVKFRDPDLQKSADADFQSIDFHCESGTSAAAKNTPPTVRSCEDNANTLVPHRAIGRSGQRLQMSAMPHIRRRADTASRRGSLSTDAEIFDELHALVLWNLRGGRDTGCRS